MKITGISGSPTGGSSTDLLIQTVLDSASSSGVKSHFIRLNEKRILPCQACGKSPEPDYCFFHDDMDSIYNLMEKSEGIILGSPVFFDSVSAQAKLFIDRTNCLRPADFSDLSGHKFKTPRFKGKKGGIVLVAGEKEKFDCALRTARGFFIWAGIEIIFEICWRSKSLNKGEVASDPIGLAEARDCGKKLIDSIKSK